MYQPLQAENETPPDDSVLWRYVSLEGFLAMVCTSKLHLTRLTEMRISGDVRDLRDPFEGRWPASVIAKAAPYPTKSSMLAKSDMFPQAMHVNCWHESAYESTALWYQYSGHNGLAIRSTVGRLKQGIVDRRGYYIGKAKYLDFNDEYTGPFGTMILPFLKRRSYEHEKEVRVVVFDPAHPNRKVRASNDLKVDLAILIEQLFLSPVSPEWLKQPIVELLNKWGLPSIPVIRSSLMHVGA